MRMAAGALGITRSQAEVTREVSDSLPAAGLPAVPVIEVHYGLQRTPPTSWDVSFKPRQQRDHHVYSETLVLPEKIVWSNMQILQLPARWRPPVFTFLALTNLVFIQSYYANFKRAKSMKCISSYMSSSPVSSTSVSVKAIRRRSR